MKQLFIKGFDKDLKCRGYQFEVGKEYQTDRYGTDKPLTLCEAGLFHFCNSIQKVHEFYDCQPKEGNRFCEVRPLGRLVASDDKCGTDKILIVREIVGEELKIILGLINGNAGLFNTGCSNTGCSNTGSHNTGYNNTGYSNTGDDNAGSFNTGDGNTGNFNIGDGNAGDCNTGDRNTGNLNIGLFCSASYSNGVFCEKTPTIKIFDINTNMTLRDFYDSDFYSAIVSSPFELTRWVEYTEEEKRADKSKELIGGHLVAKTFYEACADWWKNMSEENKAVILSIPHFSKAKFARITGIKLGKGK